MEQTCQLSDLSLTPLWLWTPHDTYGPASVNWWLCQWLVMPKARNALRLIPKKKNWNSCGFERVRKLPKRRKTAELKTLKRKTLNLVWKENDDRGTSQIDD